MLSWTRPAAVLLAVFVVSSSAKAASDALGVVVAPDAGLAAHVAGLPVFLPVASGSHARDGDGNRGQIHVVAGGDTLWDIASTYHRTPWVWPAIWQENRDIENPHRIFPGDHLWISETVMRRVTPEQAAQMVAAEQRVAAPHPDLASRVALPAPASPIEKPVESFRVAGAANRSFVTADRLSAATSIVSSKSPRTLLLEGDLVILGLGEGETEPGSRYDVFRDAVPVRDFKTDGIVGYHVEILGWVEVLEIHGDSSTALIRTSMSEMERGDRLIQRLPPPAEMLLTNAPADFEAHILFTPTGRTMIQQLDAVYLSGGTLHGLEVGAQLEVFERGEVVRDAVRGTRVRTPDRRVADVVIVDVRSTASVGLIVHAERELMVGDTVRARTQTVVMH
jgi:hypothetical protein